MTIPVPGDMGPNNEAIAIIGLMMVEVQNKAVLLGRRYQHQQDEQRLIARATTIPATKKPWDYAHEGKVVVIPEKDWQAFVNLKIEGE